MRVAELLRSDVVDVDGERVGNVNDVRLVQDGPYIEGFGAALRVDGLVVGGGAIAVRLGYHRHRVRGPWLLKQIFSSLEHRSQYVDWRHVDAIGKGTITLACRRADLPNLHEITQEER